MGPHTAYLSAYAVTGTQPLPLQIDGGLSDAITSVASVRPAASAVYNVAGQRVTPRFRALTIERGRKVLRK